MTMSKDYLKKDVKIIPDHGESEIHFCNILNVGLKTLQN